MTIIKVKPIIMIDDNVHREECFICMFHSNGNDQDQIRIFYNHQMILIVILIRYRW